MAKVQQLSTTLRSTAISRRNKNISDIFDPNARARAGRQRATSSGAIALVNIELATRPEIWSTSVSLVAIHSQTDDHRPA